MSDQEQEPVTRIMAPTRLSYEYNAVGAHAEFLAAIKEGRILGRKCGTCQKVYVPARGTCPRCGVLIDEDQTVRPERDEVGREKLSRGRSR